MAQHVCCWPRQKSRQGNGKLTAYTCLLTHGLRVRAEPSRSLHAQDVAKLNAYHYLYEEAWTRYQVWWRRRRRRPLLTPSTEKTRRMFLYLCPEPWMAFCGLPFGPLTIWSGRVRAAHLHESGRGVSIQDCHRGFVCGVRRGVLHTFWLRLWWLITGGRCEPAPALSRQCSKNIARAFPRILMVCRKCWVAPWGRCGCGHGPCTACARQSRCG